MVDVEAKPGVLLRIVRFAPTRLLLLYLLLPYLYLAGYFYRQSFAQGPWAGLWASVLSCIAMLGLYAVVVNMTERRAVHELALKPAPKEIAIGLLLGSGLYTLCVLVLMATGHFKIHGLGEWHVLVSGAAVALATGTFEELLFRGGVFRLAEEWFGTWWAVVISALVFGLVHMGNDEATLQGVVSISIWAGLLLVACYLLTRRLWLGIGLHAAWNYTQGSVYSGIVSGNAPTSGYLHSSLNGPEWLTGGSFGVEASAVAFLLCSVAGTWMMAAAHRRGHMRPPAWYRQQ